MTLTKVAASIAACSLVLSPLAAQAGTRASASKVAFTPARASKAVAKDNALEGAVLVLGIIAAGAATYGIVEATKDNDDRSEGA